MSKSLRTMVVPMIFGATVAAAADLPGSMSSYGLKPSTPQPESQPVREPEYVFPEMEQPERNPWSGVPQEPYGGSETPIDRALNPWVGGMPAPPDTAAPPSRYAPEDHRERLQERPAPRYDGQGIYGRPGYDPAYDYGTGYGYRRTYPGYGYGIHDPLISPYGGLGYPGYGYDGYPGMGGLGFPFLGSPFDWAF